MAFEPKLLVEQAVDFITLFLNDITGTGATGFGAPNPTVNDIISAEITFSSELYVGNIILSFDILNGVITDAEKTDYNGNITNILADLNSTAFPFVDLEITSTLLLGNDKYQDGCFDVIYKLNTSTESFTKTLFFFTALNSVLCYDKANTMFALGQKPTKETAEIQASYLAFASALYADNKTSAIEQQKRLLKVCASCGCGC